MHVAVVGCGYIARRSHLPAWNKLATIVAVVDENLGALETARKEFGIQKGYLKMSDLQAQGDVDIVDICTPPDSHAKVALQALDGGSHVVLEKPMCLTLEEVDQVMLAARRNNRRVFVCHDFLYWPTVQKAHRYIASGKAGTINGILLKYFEWRDNPLLVDSASWYRTLQGDIFYHVLPHVVYLSLSFLGQLTVVGVTSSKRSKGDLPFDRLVINLRSKNEQLVTAIMSCDSPGGWVEVELMGEKENLRVSTSFTTYQGGTSNTSRYDVLRENLKIFGLTSHSLLSRMFEGMRGDSSHYRLFKDIINSLGTPGGREPPYLCTGEGGREVVALTNEIISRALV